MPKGSFEVKRQVKLKKDGGKYEVVTLYIVDKEQNKKYELSKYFPNEVAKGLMDNYEIRAEEEL